MNQAGCHCDCAKRENVNQAGCHCAERENVNQAGCHCAERESTSGAVSCHQGKKWVK